MTIKDILSRAVAERGNAVALRHKEFGEWNTISYAELLDRSRQVAEICGVLGITPGDRVALYLLSRELG